MRAPRQRLIAGLLYMLTLAGAALVIFPYYWMIISSLAPTSLFEWPPRLLPDNLSLDAYRKVLTERPVAVWFANTAIVASATSSISREFRRGTWDEQYINGPRSSSHCS